MDFYKYLEELLEQYNKFTEIHDNPDDTSKHNGLADRLACLAKLLIEFNPDLAKTSNEKKEETSKEEKTQKKDPPKDENPQQEASKLYKLEGSVGKDGDNIKNAVILVQALLNRHGAGISVDGGVGRLTIKAISDFQKAKVGEPTGLIEPDSPSFKALLAQPDKVVEGQEEIVTKLGVTGKLGNTITSKSKYIISTPPNAKGTYPLVLLFSGKGQTASSLLKKVPDVYFLKAIMVFSPPKHTFSGAAAVFQPILTEQNLAASTISICGFSLGGQAAYNSYSSATKAVGLIDPTTYYKNLSQIDSKAVLSCNPPIWTFSAKKPGDKNYKVKDCLEDAVKIAKEKGGVGETRKVPHGKYPQYFLSKFKAKLI